MKRRTKPVASDAPEHSKLIKSIVYKLSDNDDPSVETMYFTLNGLRNHVINVLWDEFENVMSEGETQDFTQEEIYESDEFLFAYLESWMFNVERITIFDIK